MRVVEDEIEEIEIDLENNFNSKNQETESNAAVEIPINGIKVKFPFKPYPSQIGMIDKVIQSLNKNKEHALLESPTGSGKTMALLCGVLAWVEAERAAKNIPKTHVKTLAAASSSKDEEDVVIIDDSTTTGSFFDPKKYQRKPFVIDNEMDQDFTQAEGNCGNCKNDKNKDFDEPSSPESAKIPKIYFASRTHKQLAQSIRELKRSGYDAKFTVLASRSQYCVNTNVRKKPDINEACQESLNSKDGRCMYMNKLQKFVDRTPSFSTNMDVEDLVKYGKDNRLCPYFLAREATEHAEIIMCPYNYIIEPIIRKAMNIDLDGAIVVIDEAHNIEDTCRSAGSFEWSQETVGAIQGELRAFFGRESDEGATIVRKAEHTHFLALVTSVLAWMMNDNLAESSNTMSSFDTKIAIFEGQKILHELSSLGLTAKSVNHYIIELEAIEEGFRKLSKDNTQDFRPSKAGEPEQVELCLSSGSCRLLGGFLFALKNIFDEAGENITAFRLVKYEAMKYDKNGRRPEIVMGFWCLSSEVIFREIAAKAKAIILTSGTLSPMDTFASELCANFKHQLEANHVIKQDQIFVGIYPRGPNGTELLGNFKNVSAFNFQDDIGAAILDICKVTPFGVLCFLPSYSLLEKVLERMKDTGTFKQLQQYKEIVVEPRAGSSEEFEQLIKHYYGVIADCYSSSTGLAAPSSSSQRQVSGAIFFAVYRGKVSEGLDFADEYARAVINIGIPYPAFKDPKVTLKKEYNDRNRDNLLPGNQWYETQAFRALNQALGRCIRHRNDWGAVIFLEQRFTFPRNVQKLSKWVRPAVRQFQNYSEGLQALRQFMREKGAKLPEDLIIPKQEFEESSTKSASSTKRPKTSANWPKRETTSTGLSWAIDRESDVAVIDVDQEPSALTKTSDFFRKNGQDFHPVPGLMHLYHLTVQPPTSITHALVGSFTGTPKQQEICVVRGDRFLEILRVNAQNGKLEQVASASSLNEEDSSFSFGAIQPVFGTIRSIATLRLPGESNRDFLVVGSDAGGSAVLSVRQDAASGLLRWERVVDHIHGRSGSRRDVPGQFIAVDPRGRALLSAALDSRKFAHTVGREGDSLRLSSPLEAHRPGHLCEALIALDAGVEHHPGFAAIEIDFGELDEAQAQQPKTPLDAQAIVKQLVYYELDQGLNQIVRKWSEPIPEDSHALLAVPGGSDGPGGVIVLTLTQIQYRRPQRPPVSLTLPAQLTGLFFTASCLVKVKSVFFFLLQFENGDLFKLSLTAEQQLQMRFFDTIPMASSLCVLRSGFLFAASQAGPVHALYRIVGLADGETVVQYSSDSIIDQVYERHEALTNLASVDTLPHWGPVTDARIVNLNSEEAPQIYASHSETDGTSSLSVSRWGLALEELVSSELPSEFGKVNGVWRLPGEDYKLLVSFAECSFVLSVDLETVEIGQVDVESDQFSSQLRLDSHLFAGTLGNNNAFIQGFKDGFNLLSRKDNSLREWRPTEGTTIVAAAFNARQIYLSLSTNELVALSFDPATGALQEHPEAVSEEFPLQINCLAVAPLLEGRKTSRWLVVGTAEDQAIRVLDSETGMEVAAIQALTAAPTHLALVRDTLGTLILHVAVEGGIWIRFQLDESNGSLQHPTSRFIGPCAEPQFCSLATGHSMLALGARPWLETHDKLGRPINAPLFFSQIVAACSFEGAAFAAVDGEGSLRVLKIVPGSSSSPFYRQRLELPVESGSVKKFAVHQETGLIAVFSSGGVSLVDVQGSRVGLGVQYHDNECALNGCFVRFHDRLNETFLAVAGARDFSACPRQARGGSFVDLFPIDPQTGILGARLHRTELESTGAPAAIAAFNGRLLVGVDLDLRLYDLGRARLLRKTQTRLPSAAVTVRSQGLRLWIGTAKHAHTLLVYRPDTNSFFAVADDALPRAITADCVLDYESVVGADRFGGVFVDRLPVAASEALDSERLFAALNGSNEKLERLIEFFVNDTIVALQRVSWAGEAGREAIWYVSVSGAVGCLVPLPTRSAASAAVDFQSTLRSLSFDTDALNRDVAPLTDLLHRSHLSQQSTFAPAKGVVDGDFVEQFLRLPVSLQHSIAARLDKSLSEVKKQIEEYRRLIGL